MPNERLRDALMRNRLTLDQVARAVNVDPKTVERWITKGRTPYPKHRHKIAAMARESESYLWPQAITPERKAETAAAEVVRVFPHRNAIPVELWDRLIDDAESTEVHWVGVDCLPSLAIHPSIRIRLEHARESSQQTFYS